MIAVIQFLEEKEGTEFVFNTLNSDHHIMTERLVEIPVDREIRTVIKQVKGVLTYSQFFEKLLDQEK